MKENELAFYKDWIAESKESGRPIYLWNYLCFPTERGLIQDFNVFPGFNVHAVSDQIKMYAQDGVRGIFLCGIGEQLDFYATMKLYDDAQTNTDEMVDEFFALYFGNAAPAMHDFYDKIESVYANSVNYPMDIQTREAQFHQTEVQLASTPIEKARVESWRTGVWEYMKAGRAKYFSKLEK